MTSITYCNLTGDMNIPSTTTTFNFKGEPRKRILIFIVGIASGQADTLTDYIPALAAIEGVAYETVSDAAFCGTHATWSGKVLTYPSASGAVLEMCVIGRLG